MSPILLYDFVSIMVDEYGHKKSSLNSYLLTEFKDYIVNNVINYNVDVLLDKDIERLKMILIDDIYDLDTLKELLLKNGYKASVVNTINMTKVGFKIRSSYILKNCFSSVEEYVDKLVISNYNFLKNSTYSPTMKKIEKKLDIFLISKDEYITISKLNELGITKSDIEFFISLVLNNFRGIKCFNLYNVFQTIPINRLYDFGFDDIFFENIIQNISGIYEIKVFNNNFFSFCDSELDVFNFILNCFDGEKAVTTDQLLHNLYEFYGISLSLDELKSLVEKTDFYYSEIFSKIYIDKDLYYKEVYNYE